MRTPACFIYCEGEHFTLPAAFPRSAVNMDEHRAELTVFSLDGELVPHPDYFCQTADPEQADLFLFPYDIGIIRNCCNPESLNAFFNALPHMPGNERRHLVFDNGDIMAFLDLPVVQFKTSVPPDAPVNVIPLWYTTPSHVDGEKTHFDLAALRHDCSFRGAASHILRKAAVLSLQVRDDLKSDCLVFDDLRINGSVLTKKALTEAEQDRRRTSYARAMRDSLLILCPPGIGPQSVRLYETLYFGRIPVLFNEYCRYPFEKDIAYRDFCIFINPQDVMRTGEILRAWLDGHGAEERLARCIMARKIWDTWFANTKRLRRLLELAEEQALKA